MFFIKRIVRNTEDHNVEVVFCVSHDYFNVIFFIEVYGVMELLLVGRPGGGAEEEEEEEEDEELKKESIDVSNKCYISQ
jgi:hypothetical protein